MNAQERAQRIAAWGWAAALLGVEAGPDRILGLVEVTSRVRLDRLKPALEAVIKSEPAGYLPSPGAVIAAANRLAERQPAKQLAEGAEPAASKVRAIRGDLNPQGWDRRTWRAYAWRIARDPIFEARAKRVVEERHAWAAAQCESELGRRPASAGFRIELRRRINAEALDRFPRPDPFENGWQMPANQTSNVDLIAQIMGQA